MEIPVVVSEVEERLMSRLNKTPPPPEDSTPLHIAVFLERRELVALLLQNGASANVEDSFGLTPFHLAAMRGNLGMLRDLEEAGGRLWSGARDADGNIVADVAKANEHFHVLHFINGEKHFPVAQGFATSMMVKMRGYAEAELKRLADDGKDVKKHLVASRKSK